MADTLTTNYGWVMPQDQSSSDTWGVKLNANLQAIDNQVWTNTQAGQNVTVLSTASVAATYSFGNSLAPAGQQLRWQWQMDTTPESGTLTGSNLELLAYDNTGAPAGAMLGFARDLGIEFNAPVEFAYPVTFAPGQSINPNTINLNGPSAPSIYFSSNSTIGANGNVLWAEMVASPTQFVLVGPPGTTGTNQAQIQIIADHGAPGRSAVEFLNAIDGVYINSSLNNVQYLQFGTTAVIELASAGGPSAGMGMMFGVGGAVFNLGSDGNAYKIGGGSWAASPSDARVKDVQSEYQLGLEAVCQLRPVVYRFKGNDAEPDKSSPHESALGKDFVGFLAQDVEGVMPGMVSKREGYIDGKKVDDMRAIDTSELIYALVNSVKELKAEIDHLKARSP